MIPAKVNIKALFLSVYYPSVAGEDTETVRAPA